MLTVALAKGRLAEKALELLTACGIDCSQCGEETRKLVLFSGCGKYRFIFVKPGDVPTYVERGVADIGFVGKDTLIEEDKDVYEMLDLGFGKCRLCIAGYAEKKSMLTNPHLVVATKYINTAKKYYASRGITADIIKLSGSVELGPVIGLSDVILDIVESGKTLEANGLAVLEEIYQISARFIVNKVSLKTKQGMILPLKNKLEALIKGETEL